METYQNSQQNIKTKVDENGRKNIIAFKNNFLCKKTYILKTVFSV